jgi:succinyl-diaminopimelate desuccinylase
MEERVLDCVASLRDEVLELTRALVAVPTENPPGRAYRECTDVITRELRRMGLEPSVVEVPAPDGQGGMSEEAYPRYCILADYGDGERALYFHGHYDVVPAATQDQFTPRIEGGALHGRGTSDMKAGLAAMIYAVRALRASEIEPDGRVSLVIVPDEETGGERGAQCLGDAGLIPGNGVGMLMPEPTSGAIWNASRGAISLRVRVKGKSAHAVLQHDGINAFERMLLVAAALTGLKADVESRKTQFRIEPESARYSVLMMGGLVDGGTAFNTVPGEVSFTVDRRVNPEENLEEEKARLLSLFDRLRKDGIDLDVEVLQEGESACVGEDHPFAQQFAQSVEKVVCEPPRFELCPGLLETRFYQEMGMPALAYGPGILSVSHSPDEYVEIERIYQCTAIYALAALRLLGAPSER